MYQLNVLTLGDANDPNPIERDYDGWHGYARFDFDRHGNGKTQVTFCDGHVEMRGVDEFYYKNFVPRP
jgi:prepilin-type processing-associated H-X9-DG protein